MITKDWIKEIRHPFSRISEVLGPRIEQARLNLAPKANQLVDQTKGAVKDFRVYARRKPLAVIGLAAGLGLLVGLVMTHHHRRMKQFGQWHG